MLVKDIRLINFRNYDNISLDFNDKVNIIIGKNAQGKTNLLEAIYMTATGRSFRTNKDREIVNFNKNEGYIGINVKVDNMSRFIEVKLSKNKAKRIRINKNELKNYKELNTGLNVVVFNPEDLRLIKDSPSYRRNFIDAGISNLRPVYYYNIKKYDKMLFQRNNLLKSSRFEKDVHNLLEVFDIQISKLGTSIIIERDLYLKGLMKKCKDIHGNITLDSESLDYKYSTNVPILEDREEVERRYLSLLKENRKRDLEYRSTQIGPHRDDIVFYINGNNSRIYGSQGQQRSIALSLKLSEVEFIKEDRGIYPVLLLDDVFSELDKERRVYLSKSFEKIQTFITLTDAVDIEAISDMDKSIFKIEDGEIIR